MKWNNCNMGFAFFFSLQLLKKNNVHPAGMNLFWRFERKAVSERRRTWVRRVTAGLSAHVFSFIKGWCSVWRGKIPRVKGFKGIKLFFHLSQKERKRGNKRGKENHFIMWWSNATWGTEPVATLFSREVHSGASWASPGAGCDCGIGNQREHENRSCLGIYNCHLSRDLLATILSCPT